MIEYTEATGAAAQAEQEQLAEEMAACVANVATMRAEFGPAGQKFDEIAVKSTALRESAEHRFQAFADAVDQLIGEIDAAQEAANADAHTALVKAEELAAAVVQRVDSARAAIADMLAKLAHWDHAMEAGLASMQTGAQNLGHALDEQLTALEHRWTTTREIVKDRLNETTMHQQSDVRAHIDDLQHTTTAAIAGVLTAGAQELEQATRTSAERFGADLNASGEALGQAVEQALSEFGNQHGQQLGAIVSDVQQTQNSVTQACDALRSVAEDFTTTTRQLNESLGHTQVGLKVTVGSLTKVVDIFNELETL